MTVTIVYPGRSVTMTMVEFTERMQDTEFANSIIGSSVIHQRSFEKVKDDLLNTAILIVVNLP